MPRPDLPPYYYHDHFMEMLDFVGEICAPCLTDAAQGFIAAFRNLSKDERCLYIRMANRKGYIFDRRQLVYAEIADLPSACRRLIDCGFARDLTDADAGDLLAYLTKDDLIALCREAGLEEVKGSWGKPKLLARTTAHFKTAALSDYWPIGHYVVQAQAEALAYLLFLYFGRSQEDLKSFALRDLGIVRSHQRATFQSRFDDCGEAVYCFTCLRLRELLESGRADDVSAGLMALGPPPTPYAATCQSRVVAKLGRLLERQNDPEAAMAVYRLSADPDCRERLIRLLYQTGDREQAKSLLEQVIDDPGSDAEYLFAEDFYRRKFQGERIGALTGLLRQGEILYLDDAHRDCPEYGVVAHYSQHGWQGFYTENQLWRELFGLIFWDELFGAHAIASNGFDQLPFSLRKNSFYRDHAARLESKLEAVSKGGALKLALGTIGVALGQPNGLFAWEYLDIEALTAFLRLAPAAGLATLLALMAKDYRAHGDGFPDLMLVKDNMLKFVEVKAEGDTIRRNQLTRLQQLRAAGLTTEICRVQYRYDPEQVYVVVDIETTGQNAEQGRITEIGAVKLRGNRVIGEWQSLINPGRRIPAFITGLTGITDAMVSTAPRFAEIADDFAAFVEGAVFVAHNVNFDYGFIRAEYARIERRFRLPKLCTCAGMRRHFPGLQSYSLGNLCQTYGIELKNHHRAMADARAASALLLMIMDHRDKAAAA